MKKIFWIAIILLAVAGLFFFLNPHRRPTSEVGAPDSNPSADTAKNPAAAANVPAVANAVTDSNSPLATPTSPLPENLAARAGQLVEDTNFTANLPPQIAVQNVRHAVRQFGQMFGGNPVGTNPEITRQLRGDNPKHINFIDPQAGMQVNEQGELVDTWGTPYFFHQLSATDMEIHSAGPDHIMWTADDLIGK